MFFNVIRINLKFHTGESSHHRMQKSPFKWPILHPVKSYVLFARHIIVGPQMICCLDITHSTESPLTPTWRHESPKSGAPLGIHTAWIGTMRRTSRGLRKRLSCDKLWKAVRWWGDGEFSRSCSSSLRVLPRMSHLRSYDVPWNFANCKLWLG